MLFQGKKADLVERAAERREREVRRWQCEMRTCEGEPGLRIDECGKAQRGRCREQRHGGGALDEDPRRRERAPGALDRVLARAGAEWSPRELRDHGDPRTSSARARPEVIRPGSDRNLDRRVNRFGTATVHGGVHRSSAARACVCRAGGHAPQPPCARTARARSVRVRRLARSSAT